MDPLNTQSSSNNSNNPYATDTGSVTDTPEDFRSDSSAGSKVEDIKERVQHNVKKVAGQALDQTTRSVETKKQAMADQVDGLAKVLHRAGEQLDEQQQGNLAQYAHNFAGKLDHMAGTLHDQDINTLVRQTRDLARRYPGLFVGGAMVAGFLLIRFLTSADKDSYRDSDDSSYFRSQPGSYPSYPSKDRLYE